MTVHKQFRFQVQPEKIVYVKGLIRTYAAYVADYAKEHQEEWAWTTYQETDRPHSFVSVMRHADEGAMQRHKEAEGTREFARNLYEWVAASKEVVFALVASSDLTEG